MNNNYSTRDTTATGALYQRGFTILAVVMVIVILASAGSVSWYVLRAQYKPAPVSKVSTPDTGATSAAEQGSNGQLGDSVSRQAMDTSNISTTSDSTATQQVADEAPSQAASVTPRSLKWQALPTDLQKAISMASGSNQCASGAVNVQSSDSTYFLQSDIVATGLAGCNGTRHLFVKVSGAWSSVAQTNSSWFACSRLERYSVPRDFIVTMSSPAECITPNGERTSY